EGNALTRWPGRKVGKGRKHGSEEGRKRVRGSSITPVLDFRPQAFPPFPTFLPFRLPTLLVPFRLPSLFVPFRLPALFLPSCLPALLSCLPTFLPWLPAF